jgi:hypothetical protein
VLSTHGSVMVRVPVPERYALQKLIVSQLRSKTSSKPEDALRRTGDGGGRSHQPRPSSGIREDVVAFENMLEVPLGVCESSTDLVESEQSSNMPRLDAYLTLTVWEFVTAVCSGVSPSKYFEGQIGTQVGVDADQCAIGLMVTWRASGQ